MKRYGWYLFWLAAALLLFFGNGQLWITDSVESNYALTAKEMLQTGDWVSPQIYGHYWYDKPIFFYWLTALGFKLFGFTEFGARFFPALLGMAGLALAVYAGGKLYGGKTAFWGGVVLLTSTEFFLISKSVITDRHATQKLLLRHVRWHGAGNFNQRADWLFAAGADYGAVFNG